MEFLNREAEMAVITAELQKNSSRFLVLYGRRRIGKSALLQQVLSENSVYYLADINEAEVQRAFFANQMAMHIPGFDQVHYPDWNTFFSQANQQLQSRITICIDEFPYLVRSSPELPSVLQKIIDLKQNSRFHLILCGSSQQMMQGLVLDKSSPLFGRAHRIMKLLPMDCGWLQKALEISPQQAIEEYSVWGGIPRNWELRKEYNSMRTAIKELILNPYGILHEEPLRLFMDDLRSAVQPVSIASLIGQGCNKLSEIAGRLNKPATNLNRAMQSLIETGYIKRDVSWGESERNSKKTIYRLLDPLTRFYFTFVVPNQSELNSNRIELVQQTIHKNWQIYVSETWEELCRNSIAHLVIDGKSFQPAKRWWKQSKNTGSAEIDIIAVSSDGRSLLVGEVKWRKKQNPKTILNELNQKITSLNLKEPPQEIYRLIMLPDLEFRREGNLIYAGAFSVCGKFGDQ
ncbi:MAG: ATP-binding protein [Candidatus Cloacimonetes bacterium]|nr:ATP-binding protein [Candidatus Cloacimonadota bacterium]